MLRDKAKFSLEHVQESIEAMPEDFGARLRRKCELGRLLGRDVRLAADLDSLGLDDAGDGSDSPEDLSNESDSEWVRAK
jgi:hypothetical protein